MSMGIAATVIAGTGALSSMYGAYQSGKASDKAADATRDAAAQSAEVAREQLAFDKEAYAKQMEDIAALEEIFGPIRENLATYYSNMSPERFQIQAKESLEKQYDRTNKQLDAIFSNNGMYNSGQALSAKVALETARETELSKTSASAQSQYAQEQSQYLAMGLNEQASMRGVATQQQGLINNAYSNQMAGIQQSGQSLSNIYSNQALGYGQLATGGMQMVGYGLGLMGTNTKDTNPGLTGGTN